MSIILRGAGLAAVFAVAAVAFTPVAASAKSIKECGADFQKAKADKTLGTMTWTEFRKAKCSDPAAPAAAATPAKAGTAAAAAPAAGGAMMSKKDCSAAWHAAKDGGKIAKSMTLKDYSAANCEGAAAAAPVAPAAPAAKGTAAAPAAAATATPMVDKNGKMMSPGRAAMIQRQRTCAGKWKEYKLTPKFNKASDKWPQFWSACNKELKAAEAAAPVKKK